MNIFQISKASKYRASDDYVEHQAAKKGCTIRVAKPTELFLDLDSVEAKRRAEELVDLAVEKSLIPFESVEWLRSSTEGHFHAVVTLKEPMPIRERVLWQALLGSDQKRELLAQVDIDYREYVSVLFRPLPAEDNDDLPF